MECIKNCKLCKNLVLSTAINYDAATDTVIVGLPANTFGNCQKYCIVLAQTIPETATINSQVVFTVGTNPTQYPFLNKNCVPVYATQIRTRKIYPIRVNTSVNEGVFKYVGNCSLPCVNRAISDSLPTT